MNGLVSLLWIMSGDEWCQLNFMVIITAVAWMNAQTTVDQNVSNMVRSKRNYGMFTKAESTTEIGCNITRMDGPYNFKGQSKILI